MTEHKTPQDIEQYLARIRKTIADSNRLVQQSELRIAETDRMLESQGLTREQVMGFHFSDEQREMVNRELERRGMEPIADEEPSESVLDYAAAAAPYGLSGHGSSSADAEVAQRQKKFGMMMKPFLI